METSIFLRRKGKGRGNQVWVSGQHTILLINQPAISYIMWLVSNHVTFGDYINFPHWVLPVTDSHPQSRCGLQNHLTLLRGKIPTGIKGRRRNVSQNRRTQFTWYKFPDNQAQEGLDAYNYTPELNTAITSILLIYHSPLSSDLPPEPARPHL